jgi:hypothetical protein
MLSKTLIPAFLTVIAVAFFLTANIPAYSADTSFQVAGTTRSDGRGQVRPQSGANSFAAEQTQSRYTCSGGTCNCNNYADCNDMMLAENCTVIFTQCTGCPNMTGHCRPGQ